MDNSMLALGLNLRIEQRGYRISPRQSFEDRLIRYIELEANAKGKPISRDLAIINALFIMHEADEKFLKPVEFKTLRRSERLRNRMAN